MPCRINRGRQWTWRQYLESLCHEENCFVTLTYDDEHLPVDGNLEPKQLQMFIKRLRWAVKPLQFRFFAVGEYGEVSIRPHYHLSLFGVSGFTVVQRGDKIRVGTDIIAECWGKGFVGVHEFNEATAQYTCGYIVKKLKDRKDGREFIVPEFARMSLRPCLGSGAADIITKSLLQSVQSWESGDVPRELRMGSRKIPLGRHMLRMLRERIGFTDDYIAQIKEDISFNRSLDLLAVFANSPDDLTITDTYVKEVKAKIEQVEARYNLWRSKRSL